MEWLTGGVPRRSGRPPRRRGALALVLVCSVLLLLGATEVTGAARAGADSLPNCATTPETTTEGCGYYINQSGVVGGTPVLAGESTESPSDVEVGTSLVQTATVMANPGVYDVLMETSFPGAITAYSPQGGDGITVSVTGFSVTWVDSNVGGFSAGQEFTLNSTVASLGVICTACLSIGTLRNYGIGGNPSGDSQTPLFSAGTGGTAPTASTSTRRPPPAREGPRSPPTPGTSATAASR